MAERADRKAALLDRDGTLIEDRHYLSDPAQVALLPGVGAALRRLVAHDYELIICTNQSGIARGTISLAQYRAVRMRLNELLRAEDVVVLDTFTCPHHPESCLPCDCRKPERGLFERAAQTHWLDLSRSLFVGDKLRDVAPASHWNARGALVRAPDTAERDVVEARERAIPVVPSLAEAVELLLT